MPRAKARSASFATKLAHLAFAAPQVASRRMSDIARTAHAPSPRDREEFQRMVTEKHVAFYESWLAMAMQATRASQRLSGHLVRASAAAALGNVPSPAAMSAHFGSAALGIMSKGLDPVHRKVMSNAKRLARTK